MNNSSRWRWLLLLLLGIILGVLGILLVALAPSGRAGSSFDTSPWGSRQFYEYLEQQGFPVERWQRDYPNLSGQGQILIQISGRPLRLSSDLVQWLGEGNTLVRFYWHGEPTAAPFSQRLATPQGNVLVETRRRLQRRDLPPGDRPLLADEYGIVVYSQQMRENGQQIASVYPWLVANAYGKDTPLANFAAVSALLKELPSPTTIYFDEWLHGYRRRTPEDVETSPEYRSVFDYLSRSQWLGIGVQLGLILLFLLWQQSQRFGPPLQEQPANPSNSASYISALAGVLQRAQQRNFVRHQLQGQLRHELATKLGLTADPRNPHQLPSDSELIRAWQETTGQSPTQLQQLLQQEESLSEDRQLVRWLQEVDSIFKPLAGSQR